MKTITFYLDFVSPYAWLAFERLPDALAYIAAFQAAGWTFAKTAVLGAHPIQPHLPELSRFPEVLNQPINATAHRIRAHFGWR